MAAIHVILWITIAIAAAADSSRWTARFFILWVLFWLATLWPNIAVLVKRIHDRNKTGWLVLAYWLPAGLQTILFIADKSDNVAGSLIRLITVAVGIWFFIEFGCMRGTVGPNRYGPDPVSQP